MKKKRNIAYDAGAREKDRPFIPQMTREAAAQMGLAPGCEIIYRYEVLTAEGQSVRREQERKRRGTVTELSRHIFGVRWEGKQWKEYFPYAMLGKREGDSIKIRRR